jgi:hypothetical protein
MISFKQKKCYFKNNEFKISIYYKRKSLILYIRKRIGEKMKKRFILFSIFIIIALNISNAQWGPDVRLTNDANTSNISYSNVRCIAANGNILHAVWFDNRDGNFEIYYKRSSDEGISWGADIRLTNNPAMSQFPSVTVLGLVVHVVWYDDRDGNPEIYYKRSTDGGLNWGTDIRLTNNSSDYSQYPSISVSGSTVHVVWWDVRDGNNEIYYKRSTDGGLNWGADIRLTNNSAMSIYPSISVSGLVVHVVWYDSRVGSGGYAIYYKRSTDGGLNWGTDTQLSGIGGVYYPCVSTSGVLVHVVWHVVSSYYTRTIYYKRSTDGGLSWGADTQLSNGDAYSMYPCISVSGQFVHVVWQDDRNHHFVPEIYYKRSTNAGLSWDADTRLTDYYDYKYYPSITISGSTVHVIWGDERDGNLEIYYKRNPTGNLVEINNLNLEIPKEFSLSQNYPNPFNPSTKIKFDISTKTVGQTFLSFYDILGKEVATIVNEKLNPGTYEVTFDGSNLPGGIYFYRLQTNDFIQTKKMLLIK